MTLKICDCFYKFIFRVCLRTTYLVETKNILLKIPKIKLKGS